MLFVEDVKFEDWKKDWKIVKSVVKNIDDLIEKAEDSEEIDLEKAKELIMKGVEGRIEEKLLETESFLREVIKKARM